MPGPYHQEQLSRHFDRCLKFIAQALLDGGKGVGALFRGEEPLGDHLLRVCGRGFHSFTPQLKLSRFLVT